VALGRGEFWIFGTHRHPAWQRLATEVEAARQDLREPGKVEPFILGLDEYPLASALAFYTGRPDLCVNRYVLGEPGLSYRYWSNRPDWEGRSAVVVVPFGREELLTRLRWHFDNVAPPQASMAQPAGAGQRYWLVAARGFHFAIRPAPSVPEARP
jgi:hypothetical protein